VSIHKWSFHALPVLGAMILLLKIARYSSGLNLTPALAERENPYFWTDTNYFAIAHPNLYADDRKAPFCDILESKPNGTCNPMPCDLNFECYLSKASFDVNS